MFQSLTRDSNHSNQIVAHGFLLMTGFNPSRGIAIIQTIEATHIILDRILVSIPHAG